MAAEFGITMDLIKFASLASEGKEHLLAATAFAKKVQRDLSTNYQAFVKGKAFPLSKREYAFGYKKWLIEV